MLRIVDANLNRLCEGLRVLEDIARFILNDPDLSELLKKLRHGVLPQDLILKDKILNARNSGKDVGAFLDVEGEGTRKNTASLVRANAQRVEQSLRVLEEIAKLSDQDIPLDWKKLEHTRFAIYELEQTIVSNLLRRDKAERIKGLYLILDTDAAGERDPVQIAKQAISGGARLIQLRDKIKGKGTLLATAIQLQKICQDSGVLFLVNDHVDLALACDADGVHVGQSDLPVAAVRKLLPASKLIGCSTAIVDEALQAERDGADYVAVGSIFPTESKAGTRAAGLDTLRTVKEHISIPVVAIGGLNSANVEDVINAGADSIAVIHAVLGTDDVQQASKELTQLIEKV